MQKRFIGDGVYAYVYQDGGILLVTYDEEKNIENAIELERDTQIALAGLIERRRREEANTALTAEGIEIRT